MIDQSWTTLDRVAKKYDIGLFVGAGLSTPNAMPGWAELTALLSNGLSKDQVATLVHSVSLTSQLGLAYDACVSAKGKRSEDAEKAWIESVREHLYSGFCRQIAECDITLGQLKRMLKSRAKESPKVDRFFRKTNPSLREIVRMCEIRDDGMPRIVTS